MRVARLEIFGFKSFMEKLVLPLEGGITGVVGPNGCGKSNVVDALRWVLGETRASNLRGGTLEDVIFNGTDKLRPLGLAEVTITLRASEANFFADLVSPALEAELLADLPEGEEVTAEQVIENVEVSEEVEVVVEESTEERQRPKLTVISGALDTNPPAEQAEQGQETTESEENPFTEAEAETPVEVKAATSSATLLTRFAWLKSVNEVQVTRRLYRSGESEFFINRVPCRLKDLKDFFRAVGLGARSHTIVAQGEVSRIVTAKPEERRLILEEAAGVLGFRDKIASATRKLEETAINVSRLDDIIKEVDRQVSTLKRQASRAEARQEIKSRISELEQAIFIDRFAEISTNGGEREKALEEANQAEAAADASMRSVQANEQEARNELMSIDVESDSIRTRIDAISEEIHQRDRQRSDRRSRVAELKAFELARGTEMRRLDERHATLVQRKTACISDIASLEEREATLSQQISEFETGSEDELRKAAEDLDREREALKRKEQELRGVREALIASRTSLKEVNEQLIAASPITQLKESLSSKDSRFFEGVASGAELFVDGLTVPSAYSKAAQAVLAERAQFLVTESPYQVAQHFVAEAYGNGTTKRRLALGVVKRADADFPVSNAAVPFPSMLSLIEVLPGFTLAAERLFHSVYVVPSLDEAVQFFEASAGQAAGITLVTAEGDLLTDYSFFSLRHDGGVIQLKNKLRELTSRTAELDAQEKTLTLERDEIQKRTREAETFQAEALRRSKERQAKVRDLLNQRGSVSGRLQSERRSSEQIDQDIAKTLQLVKDCEVKILEYKNEETRIEEELKTLVAENDASLREELTQLQARYAEHDKVRRGGRDKLAGLASAVHAARQALDQARGRVSSATLELQRFALEKENLRERIETELGAEFFAKLQEPGTELTRLAHETREEYTQEVQRLKARILREGDVDPTSIERYREENTRLEDLTTQKQDLENAAQTLTRTIERLTKTSEERFVATFTAVSANFSKLVPRLFGGGKGSLELLDPSKPLDSGIDIIARPPGKKLKSIELMSGGEKCLCATALLLGMFMEKPSPLCVLDEVDAPLDEANLVRFLTLIKEMSNRTQFLIITHNKNTMSVADNLVGVTMQEPGASKVIGVSLQDAYSHVA
ncbi:MAG: AAA family ATPase [Deltaproteobacteria bacterium]|nr:AAA family ATPase [Deltaproteobacteria bacterium]